ncbi:MAG: tRNA (adenosine(37)-N6)-threonylcarbamoyltransferase complex ATPase subunit type 1 TsaE [Kiritimatiellae bacterium]|nr:tRNA (adenosine(37)-N6)-threonylcarbamoyltransferase complex ATPase subunit type 1 TsaE [Kiritimatiellia bacterium]
MAEKMRSADIMLRRAVGSVEDTWRLAAEVADALAPGTVLALHGDLGAGKTAFVQGLGWALGVRRLMTSPTFTLVAEYDTPRFKLVHMDLYRINDPDELVAFGFCEYMENCAVVAVEWPERAGDLIPQDALHVRITLGQGEGTREIIVERGKNHEFD